MLHQSSRNERNERNCARLKTAQGCAGPGPHSQSSLEVARKDAQARGPIGNRARLGPLALCIALCCLYVYYKLFDIYYNSMAEAWL